MGIVFQDLLCVYLALVKAKHLFKGVMDETETGEYVFWLFFKVGLWSAISFESSRSELPIDMTEHRSTLKNFHNTFYFRFSFTAKNGMAFP